MKSKLYDDLPDFLIIGAGKSGTTSLDNYLKQHPEIYITPVKEPNFFGYENTKIEDFHGNKDEIKYFKRSVTTLPEYLDLFKGAKPGQVKGETSNLYIFHEDAPNRIKHYIPNVKIMAMLRQPAGRLYSRFLHLARENRQPTQNFADCLDPSTIWWQRNDLIKEGFYYDNLRRYYNLFPKENIRIYLYEDFSSSPSEILRDIFEFLGVDASFSPDLSVKYNQSGYVKNKFLNNLYGQSGLLIKIARTMVPQKMLSSAKENLVIQRYINNLRAKNLTKPKMDPEIRRRLIHDVYKDDIVKLQDLIGKDLSHWLI